MQKKTATIIIALVILLLIGGLLVFYFYFNRGEGGGDFTSGLSRQDIFPSSPSFGGGEGSFAGAATSSFSSDETGERPLLQELSLKPSAGAVAIATSSKQVFVRFVEKATGNVYEVSPEKSGETRLSNTTLPKIEEAFWNKTGTGALLRYLKDDGETIQSYFASLKPPKAGEAEGSLQGSFLPNNIRILAQNPDRSKIFYLLNHSAGATGVIADLDGGKRVQIFDSLLTEWLPVWVSPRTITFTTKPSAGIPGFMYTLDSANGRLSKVMSGVAGLQTLMDPSGSLALYAETAADRLSLKIYSPKTGRVLETAVETLPEKCLWAKDGETIFCAVPSFMPEALYPDAWYQGLISFSDEIWKIDAETGAGKLLARLKDLSRKDLDAVNLFFSPKEDYLFFTNKYDYHLWSLRLEGK